jgi:alkylated DNA repair dioxygenase AlkB
MKLFDNDPSANLLPCDGTVNYFGCVLGEEDARGLFRNLLDEVPWEHDEVVIFGKRIVTARKVAWFGDSDFCYTYSGTTKRALPWTEALSRLKGRVEGLSGMGYNSCLLNLYHDGEEGMGWHSDDEASLVRNSSIASVSLGAEREFRFKHKRSGEKVSVLLENGSLLVMRDETQRHWLHCIPKTKKVKAARVNLTFRTMVEG